MPAIGPTGCSYPMIRAATAPRPLMRIASTRSNGTAEGIPSSSHHTEHVAKGPASLERHCTVSAPGATDVMLRCLKQTRYSRTGDVLKQAARRQANWSRGLPRRRLVEVVPAKEMFGDLSPPVRKATAHRSEALALGDKRQPLPMWFPEAISGSQSG